MMKRIIPISILISKSHNYHFPMKLAFSCSHAIANSGKKIKVATLNFSGINLNPFEYYDGSDEVIKISNYMKQQLDILPSKFDQDIKRIDKLYTNNRMSVRFGAQVAETDHLLTKSEYIAKWLQLYQQNKVQGLDHFDQKTLLSYVTFDYYCYLSVIRHLYQDQLKQLKYNQETNQVQGIQKLQSNKIKQYLSLMKQRPISQLGYKQSKSKQYLRNNKIQAFFIQEGGSVNWQQNWPAKQHQYQHVCGGNSVIIFDKTVFGNRDQRLTQKYGHLLNFNHDSAFYFGTNHYLLLSVHLKSKLDVCLKQAYQMFQVIQKILSENKNLHLIMGIDANHFLTNQLPCIQKVPKYKQEFTCNKMRTYVQTQLSKARVQVKQCKDFIVSNLNISNYRVKKVNNSPIQPNDYIPSIEHPYDHFIVQAQIDSSLDK